MSNLIKSFSYVPLDDIRKIDAVKLEPLIIADKPVPLFAGSDDNFQDDLLEESLLLKEQIVNDAERMARELIGSAEEEAAKIVEQSRIEAASWWDGQRRQDAQIQEQARQSGYESGFEQGRQQAEVELVKQYESLIAEAGAVLEQAHESARQIISGAELFLLELSSRTAEKIILHQLEISPEWIIDMIRHALKRSSDKTTVALCVSPSQFSYVQSVRDELISAIDAQAELLILPDSTVRDHGCVIKTSFGSIDARVETQLTEIKEGLLDICRRGDELRNE